MKSTYVIIVVVVLIVIGIFVFKGKGKEVGDSMNKSDETEVNNTPVAPATGTLVGDVKEFTVEGKNFSFMPSSMTVNKGDKVKITFKVSEGFHDFKLDEYGLATKQSKAPAEEVLEFTADKAGTFEYYCSVGQHRAMGMKGTLEVK